MEKHQWSFETAFDYTRKKRPGVFPNICSFSLSYYLCSSLFYTMCFSLISGPFHSVIISFFSLFFFIFLLDMGFRTQLRLFQEVEYKVDPEAPEIKKFFETLAEKRLFLEQHSQGVTTSPASSCYVYVFPFIVL
jgi:hypothetical protein